MSKAVNCYFTLTYGLQGCYMPDSHEGPYAVTRRKDLVSTVRYILDLYDAPKSAIKQVKWRDVWAHAKRHGTSSLHFCIATDQHNMLKFHGLTEEEYDRDAANNEI